MPVMKKAVVKRRGMKKPAAVVRRVSVQEKRIMYKLFEGGKTAAEVAKSLGRDTSTTARHYQRWDNDEEAPKVGRPLALTPEQEE